MSRADEPDALDVVFEDDVLLVLAKPAGLLSVPPTRGGGRNLADIARRACAKRGAECHPVHRLDRDTSGLIAFAKTEAAKTALDRAFREGGVAKTYLAIVNGSPPTNRGVIKTWIADHGDRAVSSRTPLRDGKTAITEYRVVERFERPRAALLEAKPRTGRFNQIRLHCVDLGCPIAGERKYAVAKRQALDAKRVMLHAWRLSLPHPSGRAVDFECAPPADFDAMLDRLRRGGS